MGLAVFVAWALAVVPASFASRDLSRRYADHHSPAFSPDGSRIAYVESVFERGTGTPHPVERSSRIAVMNADGSGRRVIGHGTHFEYEPAWTPDGEKLVFVRDRRLHVMNVDGSEVRPILASDNREHACSAVSPDGQQVAFWRGREGKRGGYYLAGIDGRGLRKLIPSRWS